ncbi:MAG: restriction endonuclease subunit S [Cyclobacteriaceae bacterium]|nr:restriction endonuclease subunit S [Cyclobacteriaceae bacterium]
MGNANEYSHDGSYILIARVGANAGTINLVDGKFAVSDNTLVVTCNEARSIKYIFYYLNFFNLNKLIFGSGQPLITGGQLKDLLLPIPVIEEQQKIASFLTVLDAKIESVNQQITQTQTFKKGLLQQMFV